MDLVEKYHPLKEDFFFNDYNEWVDISVLGNELDFLNSRKNNYHH